MSLFKRELGSGHPASVLIREVGPRDGFQNEPETIPTDQKIRLIDELGLTGLKRIELTSFTRPEVMPQLADAEEVLRGYNKVDGVSYSVLIPNERGMKRALKLRERFDEVNVFISASEAHNKNNVNRTVRESMRGLKKVIESASREGLRCEGVISVSFGCPYEGEVKPKHVLEIADRLADAGCQEIAFGDTFGMANPAQVRNFFLLAGEHLGKKAQITAHFHNTRGQGLANVLAAMDVGVESFECSFGELGGCPIPEGATGNVSTEDTISMLHEMGVKTGVELGKLLDCARAVQHVLDRQLHGHLLKAGTIEWRR